MSHREQLAILALFIVLLFVVLLFPRQAGADVPVVASAVPQSEFLPIDGNSASDVVLAPANEARTANPGKEVFSERLLRAAAATPGATAQAPYRLVTDKSARPATPSPTVGSLPTPRAHGELSGVTAPQVGEQRIPTAIDTPASKPASISAARAFALRQLGAAQYRCLDALVERESRWNPLARNASGAYGLGQAVPGAKMATAGSDWRTNPTTQLRWMLGYVAARYGTACRALSAAITKGWY